MPVLGDTAFESSMVGETKEILRSPSILVLVAPGQRKDIAVAVFEKDVVVLSSTL